MQNELNDRAWLSWMGKVRIIIVTFLLGIELAITQLTPNNVPVRGFVSIIVLWYSISFFQILLLALWHDTRTHVRLQILTDIAFSTAILYVTGGIDTSFNFLYPLIIIVASIQLPRVWAYLTAGLSFVLFAAMLELTQYGMLHSYSMSVRTDSKTLQLVVMVNFCAYFAVAYLASTLSAKLRQGDVQALENLQALHENIIRSMSGGLITTDLQGRITLLNPAGERLLERRVQDLLGKDVQELFLDRLPRFEDPSAMTDIRCEVRCLTREGTEKIFGMKVSLLRVSEQGELGYIYTFADLTDIRRLEQEIRMRDRLSAVGRMAAGIAHEIRNPLSSIAGSVKVLSTISALNEEQHRLVEIVTRESERLNRIISDFLIYSRDKNYKFRPLNLVSLLNDTLTLLENHPLISGQQKPAAKKIAVVRQYPASDALAVVDGDKLKQVFWNLCENAVRAMPEGGVLTVSLAEKEKNWAIGFADTGSGMDTQLMEKIFEPFQSRFEGGTGLGLAIVYQIVQAHKAHISVNSAPGRGSEFRLEFPRVSQEDSVDRSEAEKAPLHLAKAGGVHG
ncbi:MAG TPA: ATP-binding protein [Terriglobales bacterium]|jgi:two-component system sensor histidine kinase PilS (NtrC family)|nr:ATP-binding protein [Terriglobales bacterium]